MNRWLCLLFAIVLLAAVSCKGTPGAKDDSDKLISEPIADIPEEINDEPIPDDLAELELPEEGSEAELAIEDNLAIEDSEEPESEPESAELATAPVVPQPTEQSEEGSPLVPPPVEAPTAPTPPPAVTAVTEPAPEPQPTERSEGGSPLVPQPTEQSEGGSPEETPSVTRWPPPRPPVLEPPALRPQILPDEEPVFSRVVRVTVGQLLEIPFRGTGWVYLGEMNSRRGIAYGSRRVDPEGQNFVFRVEAPGTYALKFYKEDFIRDIIFNDYVQVIAEENPEAANAPWLNLPSDDRNKVVAEPRWPSTLEEAEIARQGGRRTTSSPEVSAVSGGTRPLTSGTSSPAASNIDRATPQANGTTRTTPPAPAAPPTVIAPPQDTASQPLAQPKTTLPAVTDEGVSPVKPPSISGGTENAADGSDANWPPEVFLQKAQEAFDADKVAEAIALLTRMRELYPIGNDELYWLLGQFYEANSPSRDILLSLDYYRRLINEFPQSRRYNDARRRIAYLERYYINIQ